MEGREYQKENNMRESPEAGQSLALRNVWEIRGSRWSLSGTTAFRGRKEERELMKGIRENREVDENQEATVSQTLREELSAVS